MLQATNVPFRTQYSADGTPINSGTIHNDGTNRKSRRAQMQKVRAFNNSQNYPLVVMGPHKWRKRQQHVFVVKDNVVVLDRVINHLDFVDSRKRK